MPTMPLTAIQEEIRKALLALGGKARYSEAVLARKIRENTGISGKKKAGISLSDLEKAISAIGEDGSAHYSLMLNSANDLLIEKTETPRPLEGEARQRRLKSEKAMCIFVNADVAERGKGNKPANPGRERRLARKGPESRTERRSINVYSDFEDEE